MNMFTEWPCSGKLYVAGVFPFAQFKNMEIKCHDNQPQRLLLFHTDDGGKQFSKGIKSAGGKCSCQNSDMVNQKSKLESMEVFHK